MSIPLSLFLLYLQPAKDRPQYLEQTVTLFSPYPEQIQWLVFLFDRYLHNVDSRYYNDTLYQRALDAILQTDLEDNQVDLLIRAREVTMKNRVGAMAENFSFLYSDGTISNLYAIKSPFLLLIFNNPDCSRCQRTERLISENDTLQRMIASDQLRVLAITVDGDFENWREHQYPTNWISGYDNSHAIVDDMLYEIREYPSIYLLDSNKRVLLKESNYQTLCTHLSILTNFIPD